MWGNIAQFQVYIYNYFYELNFLQINFKEKIYINTFYVYAKKLYDLNKLLKWIIYFENRLQRLWRYSIFQHYA